MRKCDSFHDCADESDESAATCGHDHVKNPDDQRKESQEHDRGASQDDDESDDNGSGRSGNSSTNATWRFYLAIAQINE